MVAVIPAYEPDEQLEITAMELEALGFAVLVVNDGSAPDKDEIFHRIENYAEVIRHKKKLRQGQSAQDRYEIYP